MNLNEFKESSKNENWLALDRHLKELSASLLILFYCVIFNKVRRSSSDLSEAIEEVKR